MVLGWATYEAAQGRSGAAQKAAHKATQVLPVRLLRGLQP